MKIINLFGGPGTGKSTVASDLFALMKWDNFNVELVNEYAKELTWEGRHGVLNDQLYILAKQNRKLARLRNQVEYVITDSPIIMGLAYVPLGFQILPHFKMLTEEVWNSYDNINIMLERVKPFHQVGRNQTEEQARELDGIIERILNDRAPYPYYKVVADSSAKYEIIDIITYSNLKDE